MREREVLLNSMTDCPMSLLHHPLLDFIFGIVNNDCLDGFPLHKILWILVTDTPVVASLPE